MKKLLLALLFSGAMQAQFTIGNPVNLAECDVNNDQVATFNLTINNAYILGDLDPDNFIITYYTTEGDAQFGTNEITPLEAQAYNNVVKGTQTIYARVMEKNNFTMFFATLFTLTVNPTPVAPRNIEPIVVPDNDTTADKRTDVDLTAIEALKNTSPDTAISYYISESNATAAINAIAQPTVYTVFDKATLWFRLQNTTGCFSTGSFTIEVDFETPTPTGLEKQPFTEGETLANLKVEGENLKWYTAATAGNELADTTLLQDSATYYVSQTLFNTESINRFAVSVYKTLLVKDNQFINLKYYPNPVNDVLTISNATKIDSVTIYSLLGQNILTQKIASEKAIINMQYLQNGIYVVQVQTGVNTSMLKIVKN